MKLDDNIKNALHHGTVIPAHPLALHPDLTLNIENQRLLTRYYMASGAGGVAVGVHTTQFEIRRPEFNLLGNVLKLGAEEIEQARPDKPFIKIAGICGPTEQAVAEAEAERTRRILTAVGQVKTVADLFCGIGAFTFPLAARAKVLAFDGHQPAIEALNAAAKKAAGLKPITARVRDLFRDPLSPLELNEHDAVVFDPPRAGAEAQAQRLAKSKVKTVVAASCNPATLARDARHLVDGGYKIESVTPVDQFVYSAHVEVVAVFRR